MLYTFDLNGAERHIARYGDGGGMNDIAPVLASLCLPIEQNASFASQLSLVGSHTAFEDEVRSTWRWMLPTRKLNAHDLDSLHQRVIEFILHPRCMGLSANRVSILSVDELIEEAFCIRSEPVHEPDSLLVLSIASTTLRRTRTSHIHPSGAAGDGQ